MGVYTNVMGVKESTKVIFQLLETCLNVKWRPFGKKKIKIMFDHISLRHAHRALIAVAKYTNVLG